MSKKSRESNKNKAILALRAAFRHAENGDRDKAIDKWDEAISFGYEPKESTLNDLKAVLDGTYPHKRYH